MKTISELVAIAEEHSGLPTSRVRTVARRLQDACLLPRGTGKVPPVATSKHVAILIIALLTSEPLHSVASVANEYAGFIHIGEDGKPHNAEDFISGMIDGFSVANKDDATGFMGLAIHASIMLIGGDNPALSIRIGCTDGPIEYVFTPGAVKWRPYNSTAIACANTIPGKAFFRIGYDFKRGAA